MCSTVYNKCTFISNKTHLHVALFSVVNMQDVGLAHDFPIFLVFSSVYNPTCNKDEVNVFYCFYKLTTATDSPATNPHFYIL